MTASAILSIISALLGIIRYFVGYAQQRQWIDAGAAEAVLKGLQDADVAISAANKARQDVRSDIARNPAGLRDDDDFRRTD